MASSDGDVVVLPAREGVSVVRRNAVFLLILDAGENRFNGPFVDALNAALDAIEAAAHADADAEDPAALVTVGRGKFFSNGLDLAWIFGQAEPAAQTAFFTQGFERLLARILGFPMPTIAAVNGHAFAGGCLFALAHDYRVMRADRGFLTMNEIFLRGPVSAGIAALLRARMTPTTLRNCLLQGRRFAAHEALALGLADAVVPGADVLDEAYDMAEEHAPLGAKAARPTMAALKLELYREAIVLLSAAPPPPLTDPIGFANAQSDAQVNDFVRRGTGSKL